MKRTGIAVITALLCALPAVVSAGGEKREKPQEPVVREVVVTATRIETPVKEVASSMSVIGSEQIERERKVLVLDLLRRLASLDVVRSGGAGKSTSIFIRGANSGHTLVLVDGIEMNDPISTGRVFDFAGLTTDNIERIEVIRGPQSTLYGSDAMGGVINIITRRGGGAPSFYLSGEAGSFNTFTGRAGVSGGTDTVTYSLGLSRTETGGISAAGKRYGNTEADGYANSSVSARLGAALMEDLDIDLILRYTDSVSDIDNGGGAGKDDPNNIYRKRALFLRAAAGLALFDGFWEQKLGLSLGDHDRSNNNGTDPAHPNDLVRSTFDSTLKKFDWQHDLYLNDTHTLTAGVEYEDEEARYDYYSESLWGPYTTLFVKRSARTAGYYLQDRVDFKERFFATVGVRTDKHSRFGSVTTYRATGAYILKSAGTRLKATYGSGFKAPSLYQLYSQYGDQGLAPETNAGWDIGIEQDFSGKKLSAGATYFRNDFKNLIEYDSGTSRYKNVSASFAEGVELFAKLRPYDRVELRAGYTYTDTRDKSTGTVLRRRAKHKSTVDLNYRLGNERGNINIGVVYVGSRYDNDYSVWPAAVVELGSYTLVDVAASYNVTEHVELTGRVENLLDEEYEEVKGFGTPGAAAYGGVKITF